MRQLILKQCKSSIAFLCGIISVFYLLIAFIPIPNAIDIGLDNSWSYAISRVAADQLIFGKDIIFTYGPLGYLISGSALEQNVFTVAFFRLIVYILFLIIVSLKIVKLKTNIQKSALSLSVFLPLLTNNLIQNYIILTPDYELIFIFIIILSEIDTLPRNLIRYCYLGLGAFSGFCLLTKFTLGIYTFGSLILFLIGNIYSYIKSNSNNNVSFIAIIDSLLAAMSTSFILLAPDYYLSNFNKLLICLIISGLVGVFIGFIQQKNWSIPVFETRKNHNQTTTNNSFTKWIGWFSFYMVYCFCFLFTVIHSSPSLLDYLRNSLEISSGYSSAMSTVGSHWILGLAILELVLIYILLIIIARKGNVGFALALFLVLTLAFKHGFVRQDTHIMIFACCTPIIISLCIPISSIRIQKLSFLLYLYALFLFLVFFVSLEGKITSVYHSLSPHKVSSHLSYIFRPDTLKSDLRASSATNLSLLKVPENVTNVVKNKKIDIVPWEIALVPANNFNWKPRPIFQSYSAYTTSLDDINFKSLSTESREYIFYQFKAIDSRHPFFDEPKTFFYISCYYQISSIIPDFINVHSNPFVPSLTLKHLLLEQKSDLCLPSTSSKTLLLHWNTSQSILASNDSVVRAKVKFNYSVFGKIYKTLFRSPPVMMQVTYVDGFKQSYRIIPENSENGIFVSHLPRDNNEVRAFFQGHLPAPVKSFSFNATNSLLYKPNIEIIFLSSKKQSS
ncbi:MAG: hypothetical protein PUP91_19895 [Rhizonema sp. PD37]|nr:hypothetical protein [Rhizonema sp. PD37]